MKKEVKKEIVPLFKKECNRTAKNKSYYPVDADDYQASAHEYAFYEVPKVGKQELPFVYPSLGLAEEAGEVAGNLAKTVRDNKGHVDETTRTMLAKELGDVLWFVSELSYLLGFELSYIMRLNLWKLEHRFQKGTLSGSGDDR